MLTFLISNLLLSLSNSENNSRARKRQEAKKCASIIDWIDRSSEVAHNSRPWGRGPTRWSESRCKTAARGAAAAAVAAAVVSVREAFFPCGSLHLRPVPRAPECRSVVAPSSPDATERSCSRIASHRAQPVAQRRATRRRFLARALAIATGDGIKDLARRGATPRKLGPPVGRARRVPA